MAGIKKVEIKGTAVETSEGRTWAIVEVEVTVGHRTHTGSIAFCRDRSNNVVLDEHAPFDLAMNNLITRNTEGRVSVREGWSKPDSHRRTDWIHELIADPIEEAAKVL